MKKRILAYLLCVVMVIGMFPTIALAAGEDDIPSGQKIETVPDDMLTWNGTQLTGVNNNWLETLNEGTLVHLVIPDKTTSIASSFSNNKNNIKKYLYSVDFSQATNLTQLGNNVFQYFSELRDITGFENLKITEIPSQAFLGCTNLEIVFDLSNTSITSIGYNAFNGSGISGIILPDGLTSLGTEINAPVFGGCDNLEYVRTGSTKNDETILLDLPDSLGTLGKGVFLLSPTSPLYQSIKKDGVCIIIPERLTTVSDNAFNFEASEKVIFAFPENWQKNSTFSNIAFGTYKKHVLLFPDMNTYQMGKTYFGERNYSISYVVDLEFEGTDRTEKKLYGASIQYIYDETKGWSLDKGYTLPDAPDGVGQPEAGYRGAWTIDGWELTDTSNVKTEGEANDTLTATYDVTLVAPPTNIRFTVNGVAQGEDDVADQESNLVLTVPATEEAPGRIGVALEHPLLKGQDTGATEPYVYFKYLWYDIQKGQINGERSSQDGFYDPAASASKNLNKARENSEISIVPKDERVYKDIGNPNATIENYNFYRVKIFGYYVNEQGTETKFYESYCPEVIFGGPLDKIGHTTTDVYGCQVKVIVPTYYTVTFESQGGSTIEPITGVIPGNNITAPSPAPIRDGYTFKGWYKEENCTDQWNFENDTVTGNITLYAGWEKVPAAKYKVTFEFASLTKGEDGQPKTLPQDVMNLLPDPITNLKIGDTVTYPPLAKTEVPADGGKWVFTGWPGGTGITINGNVLEVGGWRFDKDSTPPVDPAAKYKVTFKFVSLTKEEDGQPKTLPQDVMDLLPDPRTGLKKGDKVTCPTLSKTEVPVEDGKWVFTGWTVESPADVSIENGELTIPNADVVLTGSWEKKEQLYTVSYNLDGGTGASGVDYAAATVKPGTTVIVKATPTKSGYTFEGWNDGAKTYQPGAVLTVLGNITLTAQWHKDGGGSSGGGGGTTYYVLHYESNGGTKYKDERYEKNTVVKLDKAPTREGYTFTGWYADKELSEQITKIKMTSRKTVYAGWEPTGVPNWLNGKDHFAYVVGYVDGTVRPQENISRAEVATIFFRLLDEDIRDHNLTVSNTFADVNAGMWCNTPISTMAKLGVVKGRSTEHFDPNAPITRAEFAVICARFDTSTRSGSSAFTDISGHWAKADIERAASLGWIMGYADGTFRPENKITRAEAMTMINRVLNRLPEDEDDLLKGMNVWPDNQPGAWYYLAVQEATNSHEFNRKDDVHERWTKPISDPDWTRYQN